MVDRAQYSSNSGDSYSSASPDSNPKRRERLSSSAARRRRSTFHIRNRKNHRLVPKKERVRNGFRSAKRAFKFTWPIVIVVALGFLAQSAWAHFAGSEQFKLKQVEYKAQNGLNKNHLMHIAGLKYGQNLLTTSLKNVAKKLKSHPRIHTVVIKRKFPSRLSIQIKTHQAAAVVNLKHFYVINEKGMPFSRVWDEKQKEQLLQITGFQNQHYRGHNKGRMHTLFRQAMALHKFYRKIGLTRYGKLRRVQYDQLLGYILHIQQDKATYPVYVGADRYPQRLQRLKQLHQLLKKRGGGKLQYIYLNNQRHPERITLRMMDVVPVVAQDTKD